MIVLGNDDGRAFGDIASGLLGSFFHDEAAESSQVYIVAFGQRTFYRFHELLNGGQYDSFLDSCIF